MTTLNGTIISSGEVVETLADLLCLVKCENGILAYIAHQDLIWFNADPYDPETIGILSEVAKSFIGVSIEGVVICHHRDKILVGRKHIFPHPIVYLREHPDLVFEGIVMSLIDGVAEILINWEKVVAEGKGNAAGFDKYARLTGILPREDCSTGFWNGLRVGQSLNLRLGECDWEILYLKFTMADY